MVEVRNGREKERERSDRGRIHEEMARKIDIIRKPGHCAVCVMGLA